MTVSSGNALEDQRRSHLRNILREEFDLYDEVAVRHSLFRHRVLRVDILGIAKSFPSIAFGFEVKGYESWDIPSLSKALKQSFDYVLATVEPEAQVPKIHHGLRIMMCFLYPGLDGMHGAKECDDSNHAFLAGMVQDASVHRVGHAIEAARYKGVMALCHGPNELWVDGRGWRKDAPNIVIGQRQIGSQRFNILDELARM